MEKLDKGNETIYNISPKDIVDIKVKSEKTENASNKETAKERKIFPVASKGGKTFVAKKEVKKPNSVSKKDSFINSIKENNIALKNSKSEIDNDFLRQQIGELKTATALHSEKANLAQQVRELRLQETKDKNNLAKSEIKNTAKIGRIQTATAFNNVKNKAVKGGLKLAENTTEFTGNAIEGITDISSSAIKAGSETLKGASKLSSEAVKTTGKVAKGALKVSTATVDAAGNVVEGASELGSSAIKATGNVVKATAVKVSTLGDYVSAGAAKSVRNSKVKKQILKGKADAQNLTDEQKRRVYESSLEGQKKLTETAVNKKIAKNKAKTQKEISKNINKQTEAEKLELKNREKDASNKIKLAKQQRRTAIKEVVAEREEKRTEVKKLKTQTKINEINAKYDAKKSQIEKDNARKVELVKKQKEHKEVGKQGQHILDMQKVENKANRKENATKNKTEIEERIHNIKLNVNNLKGESLVGALDSVKNNIQSLEKNVALNNKVNEQKQIKEVELQNIKEANKLGLVEKEFEEKNEILQTNLKTEEIKLETDLIKEKAYADKNLLKAQIENREVVNKTLGLISGKNKEVIAENAGSQIIFNPSLNKEENQGKIGSAILFELKTIINNLKDFREKNKSNIVKAENIQKVSLALQGFSDILKAQKNDKDFIEIIKNFGKCGDENQITNPELKLLYEMLKELGLFKIDEIYQDYSTNNNTVVMNDFIKNQDNNLDNATIRLLDEDFDYYPDYETEADYTIEGNDLLLEEGQETKKNLKEVQMEN